MSDDKQPDIQHLDSTVLKENADGTRVLSNYVEGDEKVVTPSGDEVEPEVALDEQELPSQQDSVQAQAHTDEGTSSDGSSDGGANAESQQAGRPTPGTGTADTEGDGGKHSSDE